MDQKRAQENILAPLGSVEPHAPLLIAPMRSSHGIDVLIFLDIETTGTDEDGRFCQIVSRRRIEVFTVNDNLFSGIFLYEETFFLAPDAVVIFSPYFSLISLGVIPSGIKTFSLLISIDSARSIIPLF